MGALPGKCKHPRKENPYYGNDETKVGGRNPGDRKGCYDIREAKDRTTTVGHAKDPEGNIPCYGYGETPPGGYTSEYRKENYDTREASSRSTSEDISQFP